MFVHTYCTTDQSDAQANFERELRLILTDTHTHTYTHAHMYTPYVHADEVLALVRDWFEMFLARQNTTPVPKSGLNTLRHPYNIVINLYTTFIF